MTNVIQVEGLGKRYQRGVAHRAASISEAAGRFLRAPLAALRPEKQETFWALRDVSFEVHEGEVVGLIGRNGAGKSTLLKILSRITKPTAGFAEIRGRVRSLLEVGTGFHGELTGRENTYLSGSILGMSKREIDRKFDEIVAFAEIDKFIDTPVKRYSSGMYVRLAFAVAAHLEPEILLVDEVLAVGDINFQTKCLGKMGDVARQGRTIILVSHQMNAIRKLCQRAVWVDRGQIRQDGPVHEVAGGYEGAMARGENFHNGQGDRFVTKARFLKWEIVEPRAGEGNILDTLGPVTVKVTAEIKEPIRRAHHGIALYNQERQLLWGWAADNVELAVGEREFFYTLPTLPLRPGCYTWVVSLAADGESLDAWECSPEMIVAVEPLTHPRDEWSGLLNIPVEFLVS